MNDLSQPFIVPRPEVGWWRRRARALRRALLLRRMRNATAPERKDWNARLNWREFWHGCTRLESRPRIVQVGTNWTCNLRCSFCRLTMEWTQKRMRALAPQERQISGRVFEQIRRLLPYVETMTLTPLGEPLLWGGLSEMLAWHAEVGSHNLALTSNGMLLDDRNAERLVRGQLDRLYLSIDSNDPEIYASMRVGGKLRTVEEGIRRLNDWKHRLNVPWPGLTLCATFMRRNLDQMAPMVRWAAKLGFDEYNVQLMETENPDLEDEFLGHSPDLVRRALLDTLTEGRAVDLRITPTLALRNLLTAAAAGRDVADHQYTASSPSMPDERKREGRPARAPDPHEEGEVAALDARIDMADKTLVEKCHYPWYNLLIDTDGDVRPCCWAGASWGDLNQLSLDEIWNGEAAQTMRRAFLANHVPPACRKKHCRVDL